MPAPRPVTLARVKPFWKRETRGTSGLAFPTDELIDALGAGATISGESVDTTSAMRMADVFTAVNILAELVGTLPFKTYRQVGSDTIPADDHRAYRMLHDAPNPSQPAFRFWSTVATHLLLWGNAFIEKLRDENGLVTELWILHPSWVTVQWNWTTRQKRFLVDPNAAGMLTGRMTLDEDRVLHIFGVSNDGLIGLSPIAQCREQLGIAKSRERFEADVYNRKPFISGWIKHPGQLKDPVKLGQSWSTVYAGQGKDRHGVPVLEEGAEFNAMAAPLADMQFVENAQLSKTTIANIFKLPPWYLGGSVGNSLTYQTVEGNQAQLARHAIAPLVGCIASFVSFDKGIFPFQSWFGEFVLEGLMRGDSKARTDYYTAMAAVGAMLPDEIREKENMPPLSDEQRREQSDEAALTALANLAAAAPPQPPAANTAIAAAANGAAPAMNGRTP